LLAAFEPSLAESSSLLEPLVLEPPVSDPLVSDPLVSDPLVSDPLVSDPLVSDPLVSDPLVLEPLVLEPLVLFPPPSLPPELPSLAWAEVIVATTGVAYATVARAATRSKALRREIMVSFDICGSPLNLPKPIIWLDDHTIRNPA
jgi:hypothetical protein